MDTPRKKILPLKSIVIKEEDIQHIKQFFTHFNVPMPEKLAKIVNNYDPNTFSLRDQEYLRAALTESIVYMRDVVKHELFTPKECDPLIEHCRASLFDIEFNLQMEEALSTNYDVESDDDKSN